MKYQAVIFDLDGVICHTDQYHYKAWKFIADRMEIPFDEQKNNRLRGISRMESLDILLEDYLYSVSDEEQAALAAEKNDVYRRLLGEMTPASLAPGTKLVLDCLRERGIKLAIGSSSKNARYILERIGLTGFFDVVCDGSDITSSKPDPQVFLLAAEMLGTNPANCLVVEDAAAGVVAAHAGGMDCAAIGSAAGRGIAEYDLITLADLLEILVLSV